MPFPVSLPGQCARVKRGRGFFGRSGMWRGFAIDQKLKVGDAVVYEALPPPSGSCSPGFNIYVFRAGRYETDPALRVRPVNAPCQLLPTLLSAPPSPAPPPPPTPPNLGAPASTCSNRAARCLHSAPLRTQRAEQMTSSLRGGCFSTQAGNGNQHPKWRLFTCACFAQESLRGGALCFD